MLYLAHQPTRAFLYYFFTFVEYSLFAFALYTLIKNAAFKKIILISCVAYLVFWIIYNFFFKSPGIDSVPIGIETILILVYSFYFLFEQMNDTSNLFIYSKYSFWVIFGILLYLAGSFFIYIFSNQLLSEGKSDEVAKYWVFTNIFSILKNIFFVIAIILNAKEADPKKTTGYVNYKLN